MKPMNIFAMSVLGLFGTVCGANATSFNAYANGITVRNIATMQHSIATNTIQTFEGTMASALGNRVQLTLPQPVRKQNTTSRDKYGTLPQYGQMPMYGEYNDDGSAVSHGRNGGDDFLPEFNSLWANWQHFNDRIDFSGLEKIDTDYDLVTIGLAGGRTQMGRGVSQWGLYGGYAGSLQENQFLDVDENGGYLGVYYGYSLDNINVGASVNAGKLASDAVLGHNSVDYSNAWIGTSVHGAYNIAIDDTFTLQPSLYAGYTWVKSDDYTLGTNSITNSNLNYFEITPEIRAIKHISSGWFGTANVRHVIVFENGGTVKVNNLDVAELDSDNYTEYGIGLEKSIDRFNIALHIGRRDGGRTGWNGGTSFKYIF